MKDKLEFFLFGCFFIFCGFGIIDTGLLGGGPQTPLVDIGGNKYWVGGVLICFGLWAVISMLFKGKSK
jgi:hypothetical protein